MDTARRGHHLDRSVALHIINTMYVVFLGMIFNVLFIVKDQGSRSVTLVIDNGEKNLIPLFLAAYFLVNWLYWNALFRTKTWIRDSWVILNILGVISLGTTFMLTISSDVAERKSILVSFLAYAVLSFQDDFWLIDKAILACRNRLVQAEAFLYSRLVLAVLKLLVTAFIGWGFLIPVTQHPEMISFILEKMRIASISFAFLKLADYVMLTKWVTAQRILAEIEVGAQDTDEIAEEVSHAG